MRGQINITMKATIKENLRLFNKMSIDIDSFYSFTVTDYDVRLQGELNTINYRIVKEFSNSYEDQNGYYRVDSKLGNGCLLSFILTPVK